MSLSGHYLIQRFLFCILLEAPSKNKGNVCLKRYPLNGSTIINVGDRVRCLSFEFQQTVKFTNDRVGCHLRESLDEVIHIHVQVFNGRCHLPSRLSMVLISSDSIAHYFHTVIGQTITHDVFYDHFFRL